MPMVTEGAVLRVTGTAAVEDAEAVVAFLEGGPDRALDLAEAEHLHAAVLQVLMAYRPALRAAPADAALAGALAGLALPAAELTEAG